MAEAAKAEVPPQPNPEAIEDKPAEPAAAAPAQTQFQNVDLEAGKPVTQTTTTTKVEKTSGIVAYADSWDYGTLNMVLAFASIVVMITSAIICGGGVTIPGYGPLTGMPCTGIQGWQIAVSVISAFIAILTVVAYVGGALPETAQTAISAFQFAWWTAGMIVLTFFGSYQTVIFANGYFATWLAYFAAGLALVQASAHFRSAVDNAVNSIRSPFLALIVASAVVMGAAIGPCSPAANCVSYNAWALSLGTISLGFSIILFFVGPALPGNVLKAVAAFYVLWWAVGFCVVSFGGPFITPGNGYFASAAAVIASIALYRSAAMAAKTTSS